MITIGLLIFSIFLQLIAAIVAISLTKRTRYNISWVMISIALIFLAVRRVIELVPFLYSKVYEDIHMIDQWIAIITSILIAIGILLVKKIFNQIREAERIQKHAEKRILNAIIKTEERERLNFAKELHDGLGPIMSTIKMSLSALSLRNQDEHGKEIIRNLMEVTDQGISEIKEISNNLSPHILNDFGISSALSSFISKLNSTGVIKVDFETNIDNQRFGSTVENVIYRAACELINNTLKHAKASNIYLKLNNVKNMLLMSYSDNGIGFNPEELNADSAGMGYYSIRSRISSCNGQMDIESSVGNGFRADICLKLN
jgi:signal transduction histidine kinase